MVGIPLQPGQPPVFDPATRTLFDLNTVLADAIEQTRPMMAHRAQRFTFHAPSKALPLEADKMRLVQAFAKILGNAAQSTPSGGAISVAVEVRGAQVLVRVTDTGAGVEAYLPQVLSIFTQAVALQGGRVDADSAGLGRGCEVTVTFPLAKPAQAAIPVDTNWLT